jgi:hypothetical protein
MEPSVGELLVTGTGCASRMIGIGELRERSRIRLDVEYVTRRKHERHEVHGVHLYGVLRDGFQVAWSLAELDPEFGACAALPATRYNGELLARPTLVMPSDQRASRYVRGLARLRLLAVGDEPVRDRGGDPGPERVSGGR